MQVLLLSLERSGQVVSREDVQRRLWPEKTFVDFDNAINSAVPKLRDALSDSAENPRFVETVARRGYRFVAPVNAPAEPAAPGRYPAETAVWNASASRRYAGVSIAAPIVAGSLWQHHRRPTRTTEDDALPPALSPTSHPGFQREPRPFRPKEVGSPSPGTNPESAHLTST